MFLKDQEQRKLMNDEELLKLGNSTTQEIINKKIELKELNTEEFKNSLKDYLDSIDTEQEELDLDNELKSIEENWKLDNITTIEQRLKDPCMQSRNKWQLFPIRTQVLPIVTKACRETSKFIIRPKMSRMGNDPIDFDIDHLLMKNFPTITIKAVEREKGGNFNIYLRFTNPNITLCTVKIQKLKESQAKVIKPTCSMSYPENELSINYYNEALSNTELEISTEMTAELTVTDEDKKFIFEKDKNFILFKLPGRMKEGLDPKQDEIRFGFNLHTKFERDVIYQMKAPVYIAYKS